MNDEYVKLVAKIQHFYYLMIRRIQEVEDNGLSCVDDIESIKFRKNSIELNILLVEYVITFENFLYQEPRC